MSGWADPGGASGRAPDGEAGLGRERVARRSRGAPVALLLIAASVVLVGLLAPLGEVGRLAFALLPLASAEPAIVGSARLPLMEGAPANFAVRAISYEFVAADGLSYSGVSYESEAETGRGRSRGVVEYPVGLPQLSRLRGHRVTPYGPPALAALAPGVAGALLLGGPQRPAR